jgi:two-component system sensor kinase
MAQAQSSRRAAAFLAQRIDRLSPRAATLLSVGAVLGKSFDLRLAAELAEQSPVAAMQGVAEARRHHLLWIESSDGACAFVHDRVREAVLGRLVPAERARLHRAAAFALEQTPGADRDFDLAYHFDAAGLHARALPHALSAAAQARARHALAIAERFYRIAERGAEQQAPGGELSEAARSTVAEALGDVLLMRGRYDEAAERFARARAASRSPVAQATIDGKLGELAFKRGDVRGAAEALERALRLLGRRVPTRPASVGVGVLWQAIVQVIHTLLPERLVARRRLEDGEADLLAARLLSRLAYASWFFRGQAATFWAHLSELNLAERYPPTRELAQACSEHAISVTGLPRLFFARGVRYAARGLAIRRALGDLWGEGQSLNFHGILLYAFGHYTEAREKFREALRVLRRTGDRWEANVAGVHIAFCHYRLGALREAVAECRRVHAEGLEIGDRHATASVLEVWSKATGGRIPSGLVDAAMRSSEDDPHAREMVLQAEGVRRIGAGRPIEAAEAFAAAEKVARAARLENEYVSYIPVWLAHAQRLRAIESAIATGVVVPAQVREAAAALRRGLRSARRHRGNLPMALRERAHLRAMRGRFRLARRDLAASLAEADRQGARLEAALTLLARGELGCALGWPGAAADAAYARAQLHEMGAGFACAPLHALARDEGRDTLSLADRFAAVVEHGRRIVSALTPDEVHRATCEAALHLLRGEASLVLATDGAEPRVLHRLGTPAAFSRSLVERAREEGHPVILAPRGDDAIDATARARSALCAPILVRGRLAACLYVPHARVTGLFSDEERRIAGYLAQLASASLEKAETVDALKSLSRTLEQRVAERTRELSDANAHLEETLRLLREVQGQLMQTTKMAAVGNLVAGLSHEINGPLGIILGYATSRLRKTAPDDPVRPALAAIERQAARCADLVGTFLDFARQRPAAREEVAIDELVRQVVALASLKTRTRDVAVELAVPSPGGCRVRVARTQIESALLNLVDNAIDASPDGSAVRVEAILDDGPPRRGVEVRVRDGGPGLPPEVLARVFDPFFTTKPQGQGTGLGLPLARQFVEDNGGRLAIDSRPGEGTTVRLWLPACDPAARAGA